VALVDRVIQILEILRKNAHTGMGNKEISDALGIPPSTTYRLLASLRSYDMVHLRRSDLRYFLGDALLRYSQAILEGTDDVTRCIPYLDDLHLKTHMTVYYSIFRGDYCVVMEVRGVINTRISVAQGELMPLHCTAAGKSVLSFQTQEFRHRKYESLGLKTYTSNTTTDIEELEAELADIRSNMIAYSFGEFNEGINAIASPVFNRRGDVLGAITILGNTVTLPRNKMEDFRPLLIRACNEITERLAQYFPHTRQSV
jgi:DNA-binding IclR family transcriptional regulator